jgi:hypothetical protein
VGRRRGSPRIRDPDGGSAAPFSNADTARFHVVGRLRRDTFLRDPQAAPSDGADGWWRIEQPVEPFPPPD